MSPAHIVRTLVKILALLGAATPNLVLFLLGLAEAGNESLPVRYLAPYLTATAISSFVVLTALTPDRQSPPAVFLWSYASLLLNLGLLVLGLLLFPPTETSTARAFSIALIASAAMNIGIVAAALNSGPRSAAQQGAAADTS